MTDPWNLTNGQRTALCAVISTGGQKTAARELGISHRTVEAHMQRARDKMGAPSTIAALLEWDRFTRGERS